MRASSTDADRDPYRRPWTLVSAPLLPFVRLAPHSRRPWVVRHQLYAPTVAAPTTEPWLLREECVAAERVFEPF
mgnify:CR=1 FL=1